MIREIAIHGCGVEVVNGVGGVSKRVTCPFGAGVHLGVGTSK